MQLNMNITKLKTTIIAVFAASGGLFAYVGGVGDILSIIGFANSVNKNNKENICNISLFEKFNGESSIDREGQVRRIIEDCPSKVHPFIHNLTYRETKDHVEGEAYILSQIEDAHANEILNPDYIAALYFEAAYHASFLNNESFVNYLERASSLSPAYKNAEIFVSLHKDGKIDGEEIDLQKINDSIQDDILIAVKYVVYLRQKINKYKEGLLSKTELSNSLFEVSKAALDNKFAFFFEVVVLAASFELDFLNENNIASKILSMSDHCSGFQKFKRVEIGDCYILDVLIDLRSENYQAAIESLNIAENYYIRSNALARLVEIKRLRLDIFLNEIKWDSMSVLEKKKIIADVRVYLDDYGSAAEKTKSADIIYNHSVRFLEIYLSFAGSRDFISMRDHARYIINYHKDKKSSHNDIPFLSFALWLEKDYGEVKKYESLRKDMLSESTVNLQNIIKSIESGIDKNQGYFYAVFESISQYFELLKYNSIDEIAANKDYLEIESAFIKYGNEYSFELLIEIYELSYQYNMQNLNFYYGLIISKIVKEKAENRDMEFLTTSFIDFFVEKFKYH